MLMKFIATRVHSARNLAEECGFPNSSPFFHEVVFEWVIPKKYVLHEVSLHTLMESGLPQDWFLQPSTEEVRWCIANEFQHCHPYNIGVALGSFARNFGANAPVDWIGSLIGFGMIVYGCGFWMMVKLG